MKSILSIFTESNNSFDGQENGERVVLLLRRHPFFVLLRLSFFVLLILIPAAVYTLFYRMLAAFDLFDMFFFLSSVWCLLIWTAIFYSLTMYTLDSWIVTDRRVINSTQNGFFNRTVSELHLSRIQDISVNTTGVIHTFLKFGNLYIQTAGVEERFVFMQIPNPDEVKDKIVKLTDTHHPQHP